MRVDLPHVKRVDRRQRRRDGTVWSRRYHYFWRPGAPDHRKPLPGKPGEPAFHAAYDACMARAAAVPAQPSVDSLAGLVALYLASPDYLRLAASTRRDYGRILARLCARYGDLGYAGITRRVVLAIRDAHASTPAMSNYILRVLRLLLGWALDRGMIAANPAALPRQLAIRPRRAVWGPQDEAAILKAASPPLQLAYWLAIYTAQRQGDILRLTWRQYDGDTLTLRQGKTDAPVRVPCHPALRALLDALPRRSPVILTAADGRPYTLDHFRHEWRAATLAAGLDGLQFRDLRRTAMVRLAEAGATTAEIAAVSGHDIARTQRILDTYIPRSTAMARAAIARLPGGREEA